jgi:hypothetical protein
MQLDESTGMLNVTQFQTPIAENKATDKEFDINNRKPFVPRRVARMSMGGGLKW